MSNAVIQLDNVRKEFGDFVAVEQANFSIDAGRVLRHARPVGLRQDHDAEDDRRLRAADVGPRAARTARTSAACRRYKRNVNTVFQQYALFPHMTVVDNVALRPTSEEGLEERVRGERRPDARGRPAHRLRQSQAVAAVGRPAAARRARPRAGQLPERTAARRTARRARPQAARGDAVRAQAHPARSRHHVRVRHPRPGRGAHDERPHRRDERRACRADRHTAGDLQQPGQPVRRRVHRVGQPAARRGRRHRR